MENYYYSGQGKLYLSKRTPDGKPSAFSYLGNCPELFVNTEAALKVHQESYTGQGLTDLVIEINQKASLHFWLENFSQENLLLALRGSGSIIQGTTVTSEVHKAYSFSTIFLNNINLTSATVRERNGPELIEGVDYEIDLTSGAITFAQVNEYVEVDYTANTTESVNCGANNDYYWIRFNGLNVATEADESFSPQPVIIDVYKSKLQLVSEVAWISDKLSSLELKGTVIFDELNHGR